MLVMMKSQESIYRAPGNRTVTELIYTHSSPRSNKRNQTYLSLLLLNHDYHPLYTQFLPGKMIAFVEYTWRKQHGRYLYAKSGNSYFYIAKENWKSQRGTITVFSLLEAPGAKTLPRALLYRAICAPWGALIVCCWQMISKASQRQLNRLSWQRPWSWAIYVVIELCICIRIPSSSY